MQKYNQYPSINQLVPCYNQYPPINQMALSQQQEKSSQQMFQDQQITTVSQQIQQKQCNFYGFASIKSNLKTFANQEFLKDCKLYVWVKGQEFKPPKNSKFICAHKIILASKSQIFFDYFKNFQKQKECKKICLPFPVLPLSFNKQIQLEEYWKIIFSYFYCDANDSNDFKEILLNQGKLNHDNCLIFYSLFHAIQFTKAQLQVAKYIIDEVLNKNNCMTLLIDFIRWQSYDLIQAAISIIIKDFSQIIKNQQERKEILKLPYNELIMLLSDNKLKVENEDIVFQIAIEFIENNQITCQKQEDSIQNEQNQFENQFEKKDEKLDKKQQDESDNEKNEEDKIKNEKEQEEEDSAKEQDDIKSNNKKKDKTIQLYADLDLSNHANKILDQKLLSDEQISQLLLCCRLSFASTKGILDKFKQLLIYAISFKLQKYEEIEFMQGNNQQFKLNLEPRDSYAQIFSSKQNEQIQKKQSGGIEWYVQADQNKFQQQSQKQFEIQQKQYDPLQEQQKQSQLQIDKKQQQFQTQPQDQEQFQIYEQYQYPYKLQSQFLQTSNSQNLDQTYPIEQYQQQTSNIKCIIIKLFKGEQNFKQPQKQIQINTYREPNQLLTQQNFSSNIPIEFVYDHDFDENGALFYLGSYGKQRKWQNPHSLGQVKVFFSSLRVGKLEDFCGRELTNCTTLNEKNSFMGIDLGVDRYLLPTCYSIQNRNSSTHVMLNWVFEASIDKLQWFILDKRIHFLDEEQFNLMMQKDRELLKSKGASSTWGIDTDLVNAILNDLIEYKRKEIFGFRYFRICQIMKNSHGSDNLCLSGFEIYGRAFGKWSFPLL